MKRLQIKYCYTEEETNEFLKTLPCVADGEYNKNKLYSIQFINKVEGNGTETSCKVGTDVIAIVEYFVDMEIDK